VELQDIVRARRSIRAFEPRRVEADTVRTVLEAANAAPSAGNLQERPRRSGRGDERRGRLRKCVQPEDATQRGLLQAQTTNRPHHNGNVPGPFACSWLLCLLGRADRQGHSRSSALATVLSFNASRSGLLGRRWKSCPS